MKIHAHIPEEFGEALLKKAKEVGLDQVDFDSGYKMVKLRAKDEKADRNIEPGQYVKGVPRLIGDGTFVALFISGLSEWMRTSPVLAVKKVDDGFEIETQNSIYHLKS